MTLAVIDEKWKEHLRAMDELKTSVQAATFEQKDPLVIYKMEAYELFERFVYLINEEVTGFLASAKVIFQPPQEQAAEAVGAQSQGGSQGRLQSRIPQAPQSAPSRRQEAQVSTSRGETAEELAARAAREAAGNGGRSTPEPVKTMRHEGPKVGRNEPCPCGSGKKYKQCHGR